MRTLGWILAIFPVLLVSGPDRPPGPGGEGFWPVHPLLRQGDPARRPILRWVPGERTPTLRDYEDWLFSRQGTTDLEAFLFEAAVARASSEAGLEEEIRREARKRCEIEMRSRGTDPDPRLDRDLRNRFLGIFRHELRVAALVRRNRKPDEAALRPLFEEKYGVDGVKVEVDHALFSFLVTRRMLLERNPKGGEPSPELLERKTRERLQSLLDRGADFDRVLAASDEPGVAEALRDPKTRGKAGRIEGYNYQRYGTAFAAAVRRLRAGEVSGPVRSSHGWHLIRLVSRKRTRFEDVREELVKAYLEAPPDRAERLALREALFRRYEVRRAD